MVEFKLVTVNVLITEENSIVRINCFIVEKSLLSFPAHWLIPFGIMHSLIPRLVFIPALDMVQNLMEVCFFFSLKDPN